MCGIAGVARAGGPPPEIRMLARMAAAIHHRGPDGYGFSVGDEIGLAHLRLSIVDLNTGQQPMATQDGALVIIFNGEVYNWPEIRQVLADRGHTFRTRSDTEVLLELWREWGPEGLDRLNGQFAFAIHDRRDGSLSLVRDRFGVRPIYYVETPREFVFASECKALFASGLVRAAPDLKGLDEIFTWWAPRGSRTVFHGVKQLEPGCWARWADGKLTVHRWWHPEYCHGTVEPSSGRRHRLHPFITLPLFQKCIHAMLFGS